MVGPHAEHSLASVACSEEAVLGNRDLLQRIVRLSLGGGSNPGSAVPLHIEHASAWGQLLLVNHLWKVAPRACCPLSLCMPYRPLLHYWRVTCQHGLARTACVHCISPRHWGAQGKSPTTVKGVGCCPMTVEHRVLYQDGK